MEGWDRGIVRAMLAMASEARRIVGTLKPCFEDGGAIAWREILDVWAKQPALSNVAQFVVGFFGAIKVFR